LKTLLRDRVFTIRTDRKSLLFTLENSNPMIVRWFMALSQYSYEIEFISGIDNGLADSMSRLCRNNMTELPHVYYKSQILCSNIIEKFKLTSFRYKTMSSSHNSTVGHFGLQRTMKRLNDINQKWEFKRQRVRWFIDHCPCCQKMSMLKIPVHAHGFNTPMECLNVDFVGPFQDVGYVFVIIDTFTRWVELFHTIDATAPSAGKCIFQHFGRFGSPYQLRSDNGPYFVAHF
jgi:Integrase core domain